MPTPREWAKRLHEKIVKQTVYARMPEARYRNEVVLPFVVKEYAEVYGKDALAAIQPPRTGTAATVVDALTERLTVLGGVSSDPEAVRIVNDAWLGSDLDVMHREAHREALIKGRSFTQVVRSDDGRAVVGIETAEQVAVIREQAPPYDVIAALKVTTDEWTGEQRARLWLPGVYVDFQASSMAGAISTWKQSEPVPSGFAGVPIVEFTAQSRPLAEPESEITRIESLIDISDLIEALLVFAGHFGAVPIRWATGLVIQRDPTDPTKALLGPDGKPIIGFNPRADHLWISTSPDTKFGQMVPASLDTFISWAEHINARIRARSRIASTYLDLDLKSHMSAELLRVDESPMVRRNRDIGERGGFGQGWRRTMQLMLEAERPDMRSRVLPQWEDPRTRIETQDADVYSKLAPTLGTQTTAVKVLGWSPEDAEAGAAEAAGQSGDPLLAAALGVLNGEPADADA